MTNPTNDTDPSNQITRPSAPDERTVPLGPYERGASVAEFTQLAQVSAAKQQSAVVQSTPPQPNPKPQAVRKPTPPDWRWMFIAIAVALAASVFLSIGALILVPILSGNLNPVAPTATLVPVVAQESSPTPNPTSTPQFATWDGQQRFTILMMGLDKRPDEKGTAFRTDSMIIVSIDPHTHSIGVLSVPRDLYVSMPPDKAIGSYGYQRINSAYTIGELVKPGYGPQLAVEAVQYNLGIRINSYLVYDFNAVIGAIDAIGGVDIDVAQPIDDPYYPNMYYGYDPLHIPAGHIHMDGALALKYARTRHETDDLDRARRQQQVMMAVRAKVLDLNMLPTLIGRAPGLLNQYGNNIRSGLQLDQMIGLALYAKDVPKTNIHQGVIDWSYVQSITWQGADVLIPERAKIGALLIQIFGPNYTKD
jgi:LCP family protein required for cell wall assembly